MRLHPGGWGHTTAHIVPRGATPMPVKNVNGANLFYEETGSGERQVTPA